MRICEDNKAMSALGVSWKQLGFTDAASRYDHGNLRYPDEARRRSKSNDRMLNALTRSILSLRNRSVFVVPVGVGRHIDHILVREAAEGAVDPIELYYYVDYPYALSAFNWTRSNLSKVMTTRRSIRWMSKAKKQLLQLYSSQIPLVFSHSRLSIPWITWAILKSYPEIILYQKREER
jgi:LmbE family N-acetylglucosaminyl deacetylase